MKEISKTTNSILVVYVRKARIMENTMGHECCKTGAVPMKSMFLWNVVPWCLEAFVLSKFCCTAGFVMQFTENMHLKNTMGLNTNGYLAATQRTHATHSTKVLPNTRFEVAFSNLIPIAFMLCALPYQTDTFYD